MLTRLTPDHIRDGTPPRGCSTAENAFGNARQSAMDIAGRQGRARVTVQQRAGGLAETVRDVEHAGRDETVASVDAAVQTWRWRSDGGPTDLAALAGGAGFHCFAFFACDRPLRRECDLA